MFNLSLLSPLLFHYDLLFLTQERRFLENFLHETRVTAKAKLRITKPTFCTLLLTLTCLCPPLLSLKCIFFLSATCELWLSFKVQSLRVESLLLSSFFLNYDQSHLDEYYKKWSLFVVLASNLFLKNEEISKFRQYGCRNSKKNNERWERNDLMRESIVTSFLSHLSYFFLKFRQHYYRNLLFFFFFT